MATLPFNEPFERRNTGCIKWDSCGSALPFWIADMDVRSPDCIVRALHARVGHSFFGYACMTDELRGAIVRYMKAAHGADILPEWLIETPGCVPALSLVARALCRPGDAIMTCPPVYPPIRHVPHDAGCRLVEIPHLFEGGAWRFDWDAMKRAVTPDTRLFILCNPQNPLGRVWPRQDVERLARFCEAHGLALCSDEIHCDLVLDENARHFTAMALPEALRRRCITLSAPSKTYNIAGLGFSFAVIPDDALRARVLSARGCTLPGVNCLAHAAALSAYTEGEPWRRSLIVHLRGNRDYLYKYVETHLPGIALHPMQATYLAWMDCSALGLEDPCSFFLHRAKVKLNPGSDFGAPRHVRFNFGTTRGMLARGLAAMAQALRGHA
ncbi:MAG: PatB family C-S lyase [Akkermansia sp.]|nr:PatB family C-S lyase [Akkermansia sp.]